MNYVPFLLLTFLSAIGLPVGAYALLASRLAKARVLAISSIILGPLVALSYPWHGLAAWKLPASYPLCVFLSVVSSASGIAALLLNRRVASSNLGQLGVLVGLTVLGTLLPLLQLWFGGAFIVLVMIFGMH